MSDSNSHAEALTIVEAISEKIHLIRGQKVILDSDLADVFQVPTKVLNQAVRRNLKRFPQDFMFQLSNEEFEKVRNWSQTVTSSSKHRGTKYRPFVFTEHGTVMLATILNSPTAVEASIVVVRAFVKMRNLLALHEELVERLEALEERSEKHDQNFAVISQILQQVLGDPKFAKRKIGFVDEGK